MEALSEINLDYLDPEKNIFTVSEWQRRGFQIKEGEQPRIQVKIWKPIDKQGMILVPASFYDLTQVYKE